MKKIMSYILITLTVFMCGCSQNNVKDIGKLKIVTTIFPLYDFTRSIAGDRAEVIMLLPTGAEVHSFEPTTQDVIKIKESDLFIYIGLGLDPWTDALVKESEKDGFSVLSAGQYIEPDELESTHSHSIDEHIWTSLSNAEDIAEAIAEALIKIDPRNSDYYESNCDKYSNKLEKLDDEIENVVEHAKRNTIVFADSFPFHYFAEDYDLIHYAAFSGCSSESEPSAHDIKSVIEKIKEEKIPVVFYTETSNQKVANIISEETGAEKMLMHSCHTVTKDQLNSGVTYLDIMADNLIALKKALN